MRSKASRGEWLDYFDEKLQKIEAKVFGPDYAVYSADEKIWYIDAYMWRTYCIYPPVPLLKI